jgi:hypothetical protein
MASVTPGPCPSTGCPAPTQIDCIVVDKVYDSCTQTVTVTQTVTAPVAGCTPSSCAIDLATSTCTVGAVTPTTVTDYNTITFVISGAFSVTCGGVTVPETAVSTIQVTLYNPPGTTPSCTILSGTCTCVALPTGLLSCTVTLCVLFQTSATVQLLVPTYGFCQPQPCPQVGPVVSCPPSPLYPPQANS